MKIVSLGPDELYKSDLEELERRSKLLPRGIVEFVYWYEIAPYSGHGCAIYRDKIDMWHVIDLGHCSCYGPVEDLKAVPMLKDDVIRLLSDGKRYYRFGEDGEEIIYEELIDYLS